MTFQPVEWRALWNDDELKTGTTATKAALADLEAATTGVNAALESVGTTADTELGTNVPAAADASAVGLTTKAAKFKAVGSELGTELAQGVSSGVDPATSTVNVGTALSGLLAATATTGVGIAAAVGLGLGVALVKNMISGAQERSAEFVAQVDETFNAVEVTAEKSLARIRQNIIDTFTTKDAIDQLKDVGISVSQIETLTRELGVPFNEIVQILRGDINPQNRDTLNILREQKREVNDLRGTHGGIADTLTDEEETAAEILGLTQDRRNANREAYGWAKLEKEALQGGEEAAAGMAAHTAAIAANLGLAAGRAAATALNLRGDD